MTLQCIPEDFSICQVAAFSGIDFDRPYCFTARTDRERSLVCRTCDVPQSVTARDDGWRAFRIEGVLDFSLIGILSRIAGVLAEAKVGIFAISTYATDYVLVKASAYERALKALSRAGYDITR